MSPAQTTISPEQIAANARAAKNAGIPDNLNRWLSMTPEKWEAHQTAIARITAQQRGDFKLNSNIGPKEAALQKQRAVMNKSVTAVTPETKSAEPAKPKENAVKSSASKKKAKTANPKTSKKAGTEKRPQAAARTAVKGITTAKGVRPGSKLEIIVGLLKRKEGCTTAQVLAATKWPSVSMPQQAKAAGLELDTVKEGRTTTYWAKGYKPD